MDTSYTPAQLEAFWSIVEALATVVGAGAALVAAVVAVQTLRALGQDSLDRTRPVMSVDLEPAVLSDIATDLIVSNIGQSVAKNVRVTFDPPLPQLEGSAASGKVTPYLQRRYADAIPTMGPGKQLRNVYAVNVPDESGRKVNDEPVPDTFNVQFEYEDNRGRAYEDTYSLSLETLRTTTSSSPSSTTAPEKRIARAIEAIARGIGRH